MSHLSSVLVLPSATKDADDVSVTNSKLKTLCFPKSYDWLSSYSVYNVLDKP